MTLQTICQNTYLNVSGEKKKTKSISNEVNPVWNEVRDIRLLKILSIMHAGLVLSTA